jgi:lipopolysaccharide exporter
VDENPREAADPGGLGAEPPVGDPSPTQGYTRTTVHGLKWTYAAFVASALLQVIHTAVMGRLLAPADFGLVAMAAVFLRLGGYFANMGIGQALIQRPSIDERTIRAAFTSALGLGALFAALLVLAAPLAERIFQTPDVVPIIRWMSLSFLLGGAGVTANSLLQRRLRFRLAAGVEVLSFAVGYMGVGITSALLGAGVWSLVLAALAQPAVATAAAYALAPHPLRPCLAVRELKALYSFGGKVTVISLLEFSSATVDTLFIGRALGPSPLGQYNRAQLLVSLPLDRLMRGLSQVLFPTFSRIQEDRPRVRRAYRSAVGFSAALILPVAAGIAAAADELVRVVLGTQWDAAAALVPVLTVPAAAGLMVLLAAIICEATATLNPKLLVQGTHLMVLIGLLALAGGRGLMAYAVAVAVAGLGRFLAYVVLMRRVIELPVLAHLRIFLPGAVTALAVGAALHGLSLARAALDVGALPALGAQVAAGAVLLGVSLTYGPLAGTRRDAHDWLGRAGMLDGAAAPVRLLERILTLGR